MRFVPIGSIREGMILGKSLYNKSGELLLSNNVNLTERMISKIKEIGYNGIFIEDDISKDIPIIELINEDLKNRTVQSIKNTYINIEKGNKSNEKNIQDIKNLLDDIIEELIQNPNLMVNMVDLKVFDDYTFYHSLNVAILSIIVGVSLELNQIDLYQLGLSALLHDIGKVFIPIEILNKNGKLTNEEYSVMKKHSELGYDYLKDKFKIPPKSYVGALQHHERYDGQGYPNNKKGESISLFGRIISVADVYDALTSDRPYRKAMLPSEAMEYIMGSSGVLFDPKIVLIFTRKIAPYPIGTNVILSDNRIGLVYENYEDCCLRPKIKIIKENNINITPYFIDLRNDRELIKVTIIGIAND